MMSVKTQGRKEGIEVQEQMEHRPLTVWGPDLNHEFTAPLSITLFYDSNEIYLMFIFFSSYEMLQTIYVVRKVKLSHS